jgi:pyruvate,water dikinase
MTEDRVAALAEAQRTVGRRAGRSLAAAVDNTALWSRAREESKNEVIRLNQPNRHALLELMRRAASRGGVDDRFGPMLLSVEEFSSYLDDPPSMVATIEQRRAGWERLKGLEPPYAFDVDDHQGWAPPLDTWAPRRTEVVAASSGDVLTGEAGAPGSVTGRVRLVTDPADPEALEPGDIMVAPVTDVAWTPLFVVAGGVVVEVGAAMSHSMIVSRDLGIPCVVGVAEATTRLTDGMLVEVDGSNGTVRVL